MYFIIIIIISCLCWYFKVRLYVNSFILSSVHPGASIPPKASDAYFPLPLPLRSRPLKPSNGFGERCKLPQWVRAGHGRKRYSVPLGLKMLLVRAI